MTTRPLSLFSAGSLTILLCAANLNAAATDWTIVDLGMPRQAGLLVKFKQDVSRDAAAAILSRQGASEFTPLQRGRAIGPTPMDRWWLIRFQADSDLRKAAAALRAEEAVEIVEMENTYRVPQ